MAEIKNAIINSAEILNEGGILVVKLQFDYGNCGQTFTGSALYLSKSCRHHEIRSIAGHWIFRVMKIAGVTSWSQLKGKSIRVQSDHSKIYAIGHITIEDWFCPADDFGWDEK